MITNLPDVRYESGRYLTHVGAILLPDRIISHDSLFLTYKQSKPHEHTSPSSKIESTSIGTLIANATT